RAVLFKRSLLMSACKRCQSQFEVTPEDRRLLDMFQVPAPTLCFDCRLQRRLAFYNRRNLYKRTDEEGNSIVSFYSPDKPFEVYKVRDYFSDKMNGLKYGRDFDFNRPFFEQFKELMEDVPQISLALLGDNDNSDYTNDNYKLKNCYLLFDGEQAESSYYGETFVGLRDCMDFLFLTQSELCYECTACDNCYNLKYSRFCKNCKDSWFLRDCVGCKNCFGCANLHQKEYCIFNEQKSKEEYEAMIAQFHTGHYQGIQEALKRAEEFFITQPVKAVRGVQNIDVVGDNVNNSKNAYWCFDSNDLRDCRYVTNCMLASKDSMDIHVWGDRMEKCYDSVCVGAGAQNVFFSCYVGVDSSDVYYSYWCTRNCKNLFGCVGLTHKEYCIFNKQYSKEEYEDLKSRIIEHMKSIGEWGEFFSSEISPFGYNESLAQDRYPLKKDEVLAKKWNWCDYESKIIADKTIPAEKLPDDIRDIPDDVLNWAISCQETGKLFKIVSQELKFYRGHNLPLPRKHPDRRHHDRMSLKNPFNLWKRNCDNCSVEVMTSYSPERPEKVYCEECYRKEMY
ncbi:hypothetical protein KJ780_05000, partial [Candidatus Micrarchaeota archaeon]|nr:hypothetical protein [Candidatus Micrarchaeota archaeon]